MGYSGVGFLDVSVRLYSDMTIIGGGMEGRDFFSKYDVVNVGLWVELNHLC